MSFKIILISSLTLLIQMLYATQHIVYIDDVIVDFGNINFCVSKVIDGREKNNNIGWVQIGAFNKFAIANFEKPLENEIEDFLKRNIDCNGASIQVKIKNLEITEKTHFSSEEAFCKLSIDFLLETNKSTYLILSSSYVSTYSDMDVTNNHPENIGNAFKACFKELSQIDLSTIENFIVTDTNKTAQVNIPDSVLYNYPIFNGVLNDGLFLSFEDFKNNTNSLNNQFYIEEERRNVGVWENTFNKIPVDAVTNKKIKNIWGFVHNNTAYIFFQNEYFPITIEGHKMYFYAYGVRNINPAHQSAATSFGGLIGAGIVSSIAKSDSKSERAKYSINLNTGEIYPY